jgi:hypothetical protein
MTSNKVTFFRNAAVVTIAAGQRNIIIPSCDSLQSVFGTFRANGCEATLTQMIPAESGTTADPFEALANVGARGCKDSGEPGIISAYIKDIGTFILSFEGGTFKEVSFDDLVVEEFLEGFGFQEFAKAVRLGGTPLLVERVAGEGGSYTFAMKADGFELAYDIDLFVADGQYRANLSASPVIKFPSCVDLTADVEIISKNYRLPVEPAVVKSPPVMNVRAMALGADGMMESAEIDPNLDALSLKGGEVLLTGNCLKKYSFGGIGAGDFEALFTQRLELPVAWSSEGYRQKGAPDSSVTIRIPDDGPNAVKLPEGQATVTLEGSMLGTSVVDATYPGQSVVLSLLKNEALEAEVLVASVGRQYTTAGGEGKISITSVVRSNIVVTLKAPGMSVGDLARDFEVILPNVPRGTMVSGQADGCRFDSANRTIEISRSISGRQEIAVPFTIVYNERTSEFKLDSESNQAQFLRLVVENNLSFELQISSVE